VVVGNKNAQGAPGDCRCRCRASCHVLLVAGLRELCRVVRSISWL
jgi:hypothetical protein